MKLYLSLLHGRKTPDEELDDWGPDGPIFGPLKYVHTTYGDTVRFEFETTPPGGDGWLTVHDGTLFYDGMYYGDWSAFVTDELDPWNCAPRLTAYDPAKTRPQPEPAPAPVESVPEAERNDEECEDCDGAGFLLVVGPRIEACDTCQTYATDAEALQACYDLAITHHTAPKA